MEFCEGGDLGMVINKCKANKYYTLFKITYFKCYNWVIAALYTYIFILQK